MLPRILLAVVALSVTGARTAPIHYKIETKTGTSMDMSAMGGEPMNIDMTAVSWVSITTRDSAGQQLLHVVLDSSTFAVQGMPGGADLPDMQAPNGTASTSRSSTAR